MRIKAIHLTGIYCPVKIRIIGAIRPAGIYCPVKIRDFEGQLKRPQILEWEESAANEKWSCVNGNAPLSQLGKINSLNLYVT